MYCNIYFYQNASCKEINNEEAMHPHSWDGNTFCQPAGEGSATKAQSRGATWGSRDTSKRLSTHSLGKQQEGWGANTIPRVESLLQLCLVRKQAERFLQGNQCQWLLPWHCKEEGWLYVEDGDGKHSCKRKGKAWVQARSILAENLTLQSVQVTSDVKN